MYHYGAGSTAKLDTVHPDVAAVMSLGLELSPYDITIIHGWRGKEVQNKAFEEGHSTKEWPNSNHNILGPDGEPLSDAVDFGPWCKLPDGTWGIPWEDTHAFAVIGGVLLAAATQLEILMRYGGDWDMDGITTDQILMDWGHIERVR